MAGTCGNRTHLPIRLHRNIGFEVRGGHQASIHTHNINKYLRYILKVKAGLAILVRMRTI